MPVKHSICLGSLPVVEVDLASFVSGGKELSIVAEINSTCVSCTIMAVKFLGSESPEVSSFVLVYDYLVIR